MSSLQNHTIILTGAGGGIGQSAVELFLKEGATVIATDANQEQLDKLKTQHGSAKMIPLLHDVRKAEDWQAVFKVAEKNGGADVLVNCAGVLRTGYIEQVESADIDFHFDINVKGTILGCRYAIEPFKKKIAARQNGKAKTNIINIASLAGVAPIPGIALYSASKFAVRGFSLALAEELKADNIKVTVICPDAVQTPMLDIQKDKPEAALTFSGAVLQAEEIAQKVLQAIHSGELEILEPWSRGVLAKIANFSPALSGMMIDSLKQKGRKAQSKY